MNIKRRKIINLFGGLIAIVAIVFIIRRIVLLDINIEEVFSKKNILIIFIFSMIQAFILVSSAFPWKSIIETAAGTKISFSIAAWIWNKSNLLKYLPGNIFQYVGRNELALRLNLKHSDVISGSIAEIFFLVISLCICSIIFYFSGFSLFISLYGTKMLGFIIIIAAFAAIMMIALYFYKKIFFRNILRKAKYFFSFKSILRCVFYFIFCIVSQIIMGVLFTIILHYNCENFSYVDAPVITGAWTVSFLAGYLVPGAPGGLGIRETSLSLLLGSIVDNKGLLLAVVIMRIVNITADILGFSLSYLIYKTTSKN